MMMKATTMAVTAILLLGGLYLYMNRFEYLRLQEIGRGFEGGVIFLRINKLTGERCVAAGLDHLSSRWECGESLIKDKIINNY